MKKIGMLMIVGAMAWSLQACNNNRDSDDTMGDDTMERDTVYHDGNNNNPNINSPMTDTSTIPPVDSASYPINP